MTFYVILRRMRQQQWLRHGHTTLNDTLMSFATAWFDGDNTVIVLTKDYSICERNYGCHNYPMMIVWLHADPRQRSTMLPTLKWIHEMAPPSRSLPRPSHGILWRRRWKGLVEFNWDMSLIIQIIVSEHFMWHGILLTVFDHLFSTSSISNTMLSFMKPASFLR